MAGTARRAPKIYEPQTGIKVGGRDARPTFFLVGQCPPYEFILQKGVAHWFRFGHNNLVTVGAGR